MSEALSDDAKTPLAPDPDASFDDARFRVSPPGFAPAWEPIEHVSPDPTIELERHVIEAARGLSYEAEEHEPEAHEVRNGISGTAEFIGTAVGSAQRQVRRGLELVSSTAAQLSHIERKGLHRAAGTLQDIGGEVADFGHQAASRLDQWGVEAGEQLEELRREMSTAPSRWRARVQQAAGQYPLQTIAAIAGVSFAVGVALRLGRRSRRG